MRNAEQIAQIAQSEHIWNLCAVTRFAKDHPERQRKEKALERLKLQRRSYPGFEKAGSELHRSQNLGSSLHPVARKSHERFGL
jgi:hypothetical protein